MTPVESTPGLACPNCGAVPAAGGRYCPECGQRNDRLRLTARALVKDLGQTVFKVDRKVASTVKALLLPGQLTIDYLEGRRARHAKPFSLYLLCAGLYFVAWSWDNASGPHEKFQLGFAEAKVQLDPATPDAGAPADGQPLSFGQRLKRHPERTTQVMEGLQSPKGQLVWVLASMLGLVVATRARRFLVSEHLVFMLHVQAFGSLLSAVGTPLQLPSRVSMTLSIAYDAIAFFRVYGFGWWGTTWRFLLTNAIAMVTLASMLGVLIIGYLWW